MGKPDAMTAGLCESGSASGPFGAHRSTRKSMGAHVVLYIFHQADNIYKYCGHRLGMNLE